MKFISALLAVACITTSTSRAATDATKPRPLVIVFSVPGSDKDQTPTDPEIVSAAASLLAKSANVDTMVFSRDHPSIARALMEGRLRSESLSKAWEPERAMEIARGVGVAYALRVQGTADGEGVRVTLELYKVPSGGRWVAEGSSKIVGGISSTAAINRRNAITAAVSAAVSQIVILAFGGAATDRLIGPGEVMPTTPVPEAPKSGPRDVRAEHDRLLKDAESYLKKGDLNNAVWLLRRAVNLMPAQAQTRAKLADAYWKLGMAQEAIDECLRGLLFSKDPLLYSALAEYYTTTGDLDSAVAQCEEIIRLDPNNVTMRLNLGDLYWNLGKIDQAASAYEEAARVEPQNPAPHEKLYKLYTARHMHERALEHLLETRKASRSGELAPSEKFLLLAQLIDDEFKSIQERLKNAAEEYGARRISREDYYRECKVVDTVAEGLANFVAAQSVPDESKAAYSHAVLATSLLSQATGSLISYLETDKRQYEEQARLLQAEARTEMNNFRQAVGKA